MSLLSSHDQQHLARMFAQEQRVNGLYTRFISSVAPELKRWNPTGNKNVWVRNAAIERLIDYRLIEFQSLLENEIKNGSLRAWDLSDEKNDRLVENYIKNLSISETAKNGMFVRNADALAGFQNRVENGLTLSDKVWNITQQTKGNVELYLQSGVGTGQSAETISRDIKQLLDKPDKVFRRIRDKNGNLIPSKPMKDYHPGAGTYRSSKKNAMRVAATETNMGYRVADSERWKNLDFVLGFEIKRSGNGGPCSVCDSLKGKYPKGFIFSGWHSWCICFAVPILMGHDDFADFLLSDSIPSNQLITEIPKGAEEWLAANEKLVEKSYFAKRNNLSSFVNKNDTSMNDYSSKFKGQKTDTKPDNVLELENLLGVKFSLFDKTGSMYGRFNDVEIRLSNHPSKFTEKKGGLDLDYNVFTTADMYNKIADVNPFLRLKEGDSVIHRTLGEMKYISHNAETNAVTVLNSTGETKKYYDDMFTFKKVYKLPKEAFQIDAKIEELNARIKKIQYNDDDYEEYSRLRNEVELLKKKRIELMKQ